MLARYLAHDPGAAPGLQRPDAHRSAATTCGPSPASSTSTADQASRRLDELGPAPAVAPLTRRTTRGRRVRRLRARPVLRPALRLLRVRDVDRPPPDRSLPRRRASPTSIEPSRDGIAGGDERVLRRRHAVAGARRRAVSSPRPRSTGPPGAEVTVECNPDTVTPTLLARYRAGGVNRVSLRRAVDGAARARVARSHPRPGERGRAVRGGARCAGFDSFNLDLIYGAAGESLDDWRRTARATRSRSTRRTSAPTGSPSRPGTPLAADPARHPDDDDQADKYVLADDALVGRRPA